MSDVLNGVIVGAAAAAIGTIIASKFINRRPDGGAEPNQVVTRSYNAQGRLLAVIDPQSLPYAASPVQQTMPITEAAYNQQLHGYMPAFGYVNDPEQEVVLPI